MAHKRKLGDPQGVAEWQELNTAGDVRRFLKWIVHSMRNQSLDRADAATLGQLACYIVRTIETTDLETRIHSLEEKYDFLKNTH